MRRRDFIALLSGTAAWPIAAEAQELSQNTPRIGWLVPGNEAVQVNLEEYRRGMRELGYVEGGTVETAYVYADGQFDRLAGLAAVPLANKVHDTRNAGNTWR